MKWLNPGIWSMAHVDWRSCDDPTAMLEHLSRGSSWMPSLFSKLGLVKERRFERKLRLFACACCRRVWPMIVDKRCRSAVEAAELFADDLVDGERLTLLRKAAAESPFGPADRAASATAWENSLLGAKRAAQQAVRAVEWRAGRATWNEVGAAERAAQADLLREILGDPWHRANLDHAAKTDRLSEINSLAFCAYETGSERDRTAIADALEMRGCTDHMLVKHLRLPGAHPRGCWAIDALLGKR